MNPVHTYEYAFDVFFCQREDEKMLLKETPEVAKNYKVTDKIKGKVAFVDRFCPLKVKGRRQRHVLTPEDLKYKKARLTFIPVDFIHSTEVPK